MAINNPSMGELNVSAYQISATPFVTSSTVALGDTKRIDFGNVSKFLVIKNNAASTSTNVISIAFTQGGLDPVNSNYFFLSGSESFSGELRADRLFISGSSGSETSFTVVAGLTFIPQRNFTLITGSNGFPGVG